MKRALFISVLTLQLPLLAAWGLAGEALLFRPSLGRPYTAIESPTLRVGDTPLAGRWVGNTKPDYSWGYRIGLDYQRCALNARASWSSWIHTDPFSLNVGSDKLIWLTFIHPDFIADFVSSGSLRRRDQYKVQAIDGDVGIQRSDCCSRWNFHPFVGLRYARIRYNVSIDVAGTNQSGDPELITDRWESDIQGTGPRAGLDAHYGLCWGLRLFGNASATLLLGTAKGRYLDFQNDDGSLSFTADRMSPASLVIGNLEGRFGVGLCREVCRCLTVEGEVGYQLSYYSEGTIGAQFFDNGKDGVSAVTRVPFALDGWNFRLGVHY